MYKPLLVLKIILVYQSHTWLRSFGSHLEKAGIRIKFTRSGSWPPASFRTLYGTPGQPLVVIQLLFYFQL